VFVSRFASAKSVDLSPCLPLEDVPMKSSATIFSIAEVSWVKSAASQFDSRLFNFAAIESSAGDTSVLWDGLAVGIGVGLGEGLGVAVGLGVEIGVGLGEGLGVAVGLGVEIGVAVGVGLGFGVGVAVGFGRGVGLGFGEEMAVALGLGGNGPVGAKVGVTIDREVEAAEDLGAGVETVTGLGDVAGRDGFASGVAIVIGVVAGVSAGSNDRFSNGLGTGGVNSRGSGETVSSGLTDALGFGAVVGAAFGFGVDAGVSSLGAGLFWRKGVEAASCARTRVAVTKNTVARTNKRMMIIRVSLAKLLRRR
jgi:hypothetical protein